MVWHGPGACGNVHGEGGVGGNGGDIQRGGRREEEESAVMDPPLMLPASHEPTGPAGEPRYAENRPSGAARIDHTNASDHHFCSPFLN